MNVQAAKEKLHDIIDHADESVVFRLLAIIEGANEAPHYEYDEQTLNLLRERSEMYLKKKSELYSVEESLEMIRQHRKGHGI